MAEALRRHIRDLLYDYALQHLTTDYLEFTENQVYNLLSECLHQVPLADSFHVRLPEEPFDALSRIYKLDSLIATAESPPNSPRALQYLRQVLATLKPAKSLKTASQRAVDNDAYGYAPPEPFEPILSRRARQAKSLSHPPDLNAFLRSSQVNIAAIVDVPPIEEPANTLDLDSVLNVTWSLTPETALQVKSLLRSTAALSRPGPSYKNPYLDPTYPRPDSPPLSILLDPAPEFVPIFPRKRMPGNKPPNGAGIPSFNCPRSMVDLGADLVQVKQEEDEFSEEYLRRESMKIVDGWAPKPSTRSSSPSSDSSSSSQERVDQLSSPTSDPMLHFKPQTSSPNTDESGSKTPIKLLEESRMDLPALPRSKRIGIGSTNTGVEKNTSYAAFLLNALTTKSRDVQDQSDLELVLGQPAASIVPGATETALIPLGKQESSLEQDLLAISGFRQVQGENPVQFALKEKLSDSGRGIFDKMLMEVPLLPPPNEHSLNDDVLFLGKNLLEHVVPPTNRASGTTNKVHQFLKTVNGTQSATLELSWSPFSVSYPLPIREQVLGVDGSDYLDSTGIFDVFQRMGLTKAQGLTKIKALVASVGGKSLGDTLSGSDSNSNLDRSERIWTLWSYKADQVLQNVIQREAYGDYQGQGWPGKIILTRAERKRLAEMGTGRGEPAEVAHPSRLGHKDEATTTLNFSNASPVPVLMNNPQQHQATISPDSSSPSVLSLFVINEDQEQEYMFPRAETEFGIPYYLSPQRSGRDTGEAPPGQMSIDAFRLEERHAEVFQGSDFDGFASDTENRDSLRPPYASIRDPAFPPSSQDLSTLWDYTIDAPSPPRHENDGFDDRPTKRPRLYREGAGDDDNLEQEGTTEDSSIGFATARRPSPPPPLHTDSQPVPVLTVNGSPPTPTDAQQSPRPAQAPHSLIVSKMPGHDRSARIAEFAKLRAKNLRTPESRKVPAESRTPVTLKTQVAAPGDNNTKTAPDSVFDKNTLRIPPQHDRKLPTSSHWYLASMNVLQKQALVRALRSKDCGIGLVERDSIVDVDLIIDPHNAIIFSNLLSLPSQVEALTNVICDQSWRFDHLLVVFEAFAPSIAFKLDSAVSAKQSLSAYSPPVLKAIKKFRRDVALGEACNKKRAGCQVMTAFAENVDDAAMIARIFGDEAELRDADSGLWGDRAWLETEVTEYELSLAATDGMNHFAACVILCQTTIDEFLDIGPEVRMARFASHIGQDRMRKLNEVIECRLKDVQEDARRGRP